MRPGRPSCVLALVAPLAALAAGPCSEPRFDDATTVAAGVASSRLIAADLNGDGADDLVMLDAAPSGSLRVVWGRGDRDLGTPRHLATPPVTVLYDAVDARGRGRRVDLLVRTASGPALLLAEGGGFREMQVPFDPAQAAGIAFADVNRDGFADYVGLVGANPRLETYLGDGYGGFRLASASPVEGAAVATSLALADVDGDGLVDAIVGGARVLHATVFTLRGDGRGAFEGAREVAAIDRLFGPRVRTADFDGDGAADLLIHTSTPALGGFAEVNDVSYGDGRGTFTPPERVAAATSSAMAPGDLDGDGRADLIEASFSRTSPVPQIKVHRSLPGRRFAPSLVGTRALGGVQTADLDGDGLLDVAGTAVSGSLRLLFNTCDGASFTRSFLVPAVLSVHGAGGAGLGTELVLTNRGSTDVDVELGYTATFGGGSGSARLSLARGRQRIVPDAVAELRSLGLPLPDGEGHVGSLRVRFSGAASPGDVSVQARTISPFGPGEVGVGLDPLPVAEGLTVTSAIALLRESAEVRTNLAFVSLARPGEGDVVLRATISSETSSVTLPSVRLAPGAFVQLDRALASTGLAEAWCVIERLSGDAAYAAYAVLTDNASGDGSVLPARAIPAVASYSRPVGFLPVVAETDAYTTEVVLANLSPSPGSVQLTLRAPGGSGTLTASLPARGLVTLPAFASALCGSAGLCAGPVLLSTTSPVAVQAVALTRGKGPGGRFGVAVPAGSGYPTSGIWLDGLRQDERHRTNLGISTDGRYRIEVFDGDTGALAATVEDVWVTGWVQLSSVLAVHAPGVRNAYARVTRVPPLLAGDIVPAVYAVLNDGASPGLGTGDGTFLTPR